MLKAIYAISSAHCERKGINMEEKAPDLHSKALHGLEDLLRRRDRYKSDEILAIIVLLVYYEVSSVFRHFQKSTTETIIAYSERLFRGC